MQASYTG